MKRLLPVLFAAVLALVVVGCKGGVESVVGTYKMQLPTSAGAPQMDLTLELKPDNSFKMMFMEGTYAVSGDTVELTPTKMMGFEAKDASKEKLILKVEDGGKVLAVQGAAGKSVPPQVANAKFVKQ